jgi:hypothetical protein
LFFNRVRSDEGFTVKLRVFRGFVEYREADHVAVIPIHPVVGRPLVHVFEAPRFAWKSPYSSEPISEERRRAILARVVAALKFRKCAVEIVRSPS